jgi:hypothetical protein
VHKETCLSGAKEEVARLSQPGLLGGNNNRDNKIQQEEAWRHPCSMEQGQFLPEIEFLDINLANRK